MAGHTEIRSAGFDGHLRRRVLAIGGLLVAAGLAIVAEGQDAASGSNVDPFSFAVQLTPVEAAALEHRLRNVIAAEGLSGDPAAGRNLPSIDDPIVQLGKLLFFSKSLSGDFDTACASCHHPALGGADGLPLPVGTGAVDPDIVGPGRRTADGLPNVGRHSPSVFNIGLYDSGLFWDSRVESLDKSAGSNGAGAGIRTPESALNEADASLPAGTTLPAAQARFPVTVPEEMRGSLLPGADEAAVRQHLAARIGDYGSGRGEIADNHWLERFQRAFDSEQDAEELVTFDHIALALAEYQRSMVFVDTSWNAYVRGDATAISDAAKQGALLFYEPPENGGFDCARCHGGDAFTDERHTVTAFPQIGAGKGDGATSDADFGREQQTGDPAHRFTFRTPTLLNLEVTAPYTHAGAYETLAETILHYVIPELVIEGFVRRGGMCSLEQFETVADCASAFPNVRLNTALALTRVRELRAAGSDETFADISNSPISDAGPFGAFLVMLTDPCTLDYNCLRPWIPAPAEAPDEHQLDATDADGDPVTVRSSSLAAFASLAGVAELMEALQIRIPGPNSAPTGAGPNVQ